MTESPSPLTMLLSRHTRRREFIAGLGAAAAWPAAVFGQQGERIRRVSVLSANAENDRQSQIRFGIFREGLAKLGWVEGRNLRMNFRFGADDLGLLRAYAAELVNGNPDVIVASTRAGLLVAQEQTRTIPIVMVGAGNVAGNIVKNLARPEGNVTGVANVFALFGGKWLELLKGAEPTLARVGVIYTAHSTAADNLPAVEEAARVLGVEMTGIPSHDSLEIVRAIDAFASKPHGGLMILPQAPIPEVRKIIFQLARQYRMPTIYSNESLVTDEGAALMSYGPTFDELYRRAPYLPSAWR